MSEDNGSNTSTSVSSYPSWAVGTAQNVLNRGNSLANTPYQQYTGQRIANLAPEQTQGFGMVSDIAKNGTAGTNAANSDYAKTMSGDYLSPDSNPYLQANVNAALDQVQGRVNKQFSGANYGSTAHQETLSKNLADAANTAYGQNYASERKNMMTGQALAPAYQNMAYTDAQNLIGVGDVYRENAQDYLNQNYQDWQDAQNQPYKNLDTLVSALNGAVGNQGTTTTTQSNPYKTNRYSSAIGGASAGYGLGNAMGGYGMYGAALGGLAGLLG